MWLARPDKTERRRERQELHEGTRESVEALLYSPLNLPKLKYQLFPRGKSKEGGDE